MGSDESPIRCVFTGQSLIEEPLAPTHEDAYARLKALIADCTVRFTNLEGAIRDGRAGWPTKDSVHAPGPEVLDQLEEIGFNLFSLANNHAWDAGIDGVLDTLEQMEQRSLSHAGTGRNLDHAQEPAYIETADGTVALIAMAAGGLPEHAFATEPEAGDRPGVNPLRVRTSRRLPEEDFARMQEIAQGFGADTERDDRTLEFLGRRFVRGDDYEVVRRIQPEGRSRHLRLIRETTDRADLVLVYMHQHHWESDSIRVGSWLREFARECIDAGAHGFLGHGVPMLQPVEIYKGMPICYSLGNFIFHSYNPAQWSDPWCWQSVILDGTFENGRWQELTARPITLAQPEILSTNDFSRSSRNSPMLAADEQAKAIIERLKTLSEPFGTEVRFEEGYGNIAIDR